MLVYLFPAIVLAIPLFVVFSRLGLRDSLAGLSIVYLAQTIPVALYMLRTYFETVPREIEEAALVDGCGRLTVIRRVTLPLSAPAIASVSLYVFMIAWNEFLFAFLFLQADRGQVDTAARVAAARHRRGRQDRADGRLGDHLGADHHPVLRRRAIPHRGPHRRRRQGLSG